MNKKTFLNEDDEEITVEVRGKKIWVSSRGIRDGKPFLFRPTVHVKAGEMTELKISDIARKVKRSGTVVLKNGVMLSGNECVQIYSTALELNYKEQ